jgi:uncharacterized protein YecT (DUF1311 family)
MIRPALLAIAIMLLSVPARADAITGADCSKPQGAQRIINHCLGLKFKAEDERLSAVYEAALAALGRAEDKTRLQGAETLWLQFRDAQCGFEAGRHGGSSFSMFHSLCAIRLTNARSEELRNYTACSLGQDDCKRQ